MRVYLSSTFEDLAEHRRVAIQMLRQLGHEVVAMEDYVSESAVPITKVLEDVKDCDIFISIVAWRYGYIPPKAPKLAKANSGKTSITEYEYRQATARKKSVLVFLLDERAAWPAHFIDGVRKPQMGEAILNFRAELQRERLVSYFTTPDSLASRVAASIGTVGMRNEMMRQLVAPLGSKETGVFTTPDYLSDSYTMPIVELVVGMVSTGSLRSALRRIHRQADLFERRVLSRPPGPDVTQTARNYLEVEWNKIVGAKPLDSVPESMIQQVVNAPNLRLWLGDSLIETPVRVEDIKSASAIDLLRILDYPNDFVPVVSSKPSRRQKLQLVDKRQLSGRLARESIIEMLDRLGVR
ncbi:MAG: DUF4062 domain-containing protein [Desulfobacteraceae bacterium]